MTSATCTFNSTSTFPEKNFTTDPAAFDALKAILPSLEIRPSHLLAETMTEIKLDFEDVDPSQQARAAGAQPEWMMMTRTDTRLVASEFSVLHNKPEVQRLADGLPWQQLLPFAFLHWPELSGVRIASITIRI
jgi:hypothetical protein